MKSLWKSLWMGCALFGVLAGAAGCGPQQAFCPNTGNSQGVCPILGDDGGGIMQDADNTLVCPDGSMPGFNSALMYVCIPNSN
jgi:hypothetical protein